MRPHLAVRLLAHLSDTHVVAADSDEELHVDNNGRLATAVRSINEESPAVSAVLHTGDVVQHGTPGEYEMLAELLAPLSVPMWPIPGNHDDRSTLRSMFPHVPWAAADHASWVADIDGVRVVGLDSTLPGEPGAEFDDARERWLVSALAPPHAGPTLLALHHPPFTTGIAWMDRAGFAGLDRLRSVLVEHPVDRVLCGHLHRPIASTIARIPVQAALPTVQNVTLDLAPDAGVSLVLDPVGYLLHRIAGDGIVTHTRYLDTGEEPFVPSWAAELDATVAGGDTPG